MAYQLVAEPAFRIVTAIPILLLGLYVFKSNHKDLANRVFCLFCILWTAWIVTANMVSLSVDIPTGTTWNQLYVYSALLTLAPLLHFVLVFPVRSGLLRHRWLAPGLYAAGGVGVAWAIWREDDMMGTPTYDNILEILSPDARPVVFFFVSLSFTIAVLILTLRFIFSDLEVTRKRIFFVTFALATWTFYFDIADVHLNRSKEFVGAFDGADLTYWQLTLASDALVVFLYFSLLLFLSLRTQSRERRRESNVLLGAGALALVTGFLDPIAQGLLGLAYPTTAFLWRLAAVGLMFYAILRYQLFDLHVRLRIGVKYGTMTTIFAAVFFTVQEVVKDYGGRLFGASGEQAILGYFVGLAAAAGLVFLFQPVQRFIDRISHRVVPAESTENYEKYRAMEIYRAALEGALSDQAVSPVESHSLRNLREKLGISDADHALLERDVRAGMEKFVA